MSDLLRVRNGTPQWPYSLAQLRADEPRLSFSSDPSDEDYAALATQLDPPIFVYRVQIVGQPAYDTATQVIVPGFPELLPDGKWYQVWIIQDLPPRPADQPGFVVSLRGPVIDRSVSPPSYFYEWIVTELPPNYEGLHIDLDGSDLMDVVSRRSTPVLVLSTGAARSLGEAYTALNTINGVYAIERTSRELMSILDRLTTRYQNDLTDTPTLRTRFQNRLTAWVNAVDFNAEDRDTLRAYLLQYVPTRGYTVP